MQGEYERVLFYYSDLPRFFVSLLAGASLALAGAISQMALRNPLASPTTLGTASGAQLALTLAFTFAPSALSYGSPLIAFAGAAAATALAFGLASRRGFSPVVLILAGLLINLYCGSAQYALSLFRQEEALSVYIWSAGSLLQNGWSGAIILTPAFLVAALVTAIFLRPLALIGLGDDSAHSLGISVRTVRLALLLVATVLTGLVVSVVGVVGFVGLLAPWLARLTGARTASSQLLWSPAIGAVFLWVADQAAQLAGGGHYEVPTGIITAFLGAPILLVLLSRLKREQSVESEGSNLVRKLPHPWLWIASILTLLVPAILFGLSANWVPASFGFVFDPVFGDLFEWRAPRLFAALLAGMLLPFAGTALQRLFSNSMASPELLGVSSGAAMGMVLVLLLVPSAEYQLQLGGGVAGAVIPLAMMLLLGARSKFAPERMLLAGVATTTVCGAVLTALMASGDPRLWSIRGLLAGSTYQTTWDQLLAVSAVAFPAMFGVVLCFRWLDILPLGVPTASALGVRISGTRIAILLISSVLSTGATLLVGPISFIGLMAPQIARLLGLRGSLQQLAGSAAVGMMIMVLADWFGRYLMFPYQIPLGLVTTFIGGPYLIWLLWIRR